MYLFFCKLGQMFSTKGIFDIYGHLTGLYLFTFWLLVSL